LAANSGVGFPAGVALLRDGSKALVSGVDPRTRRDIVHIVEVESGRMSVLCRPIENAGGLSAGIGCATRGVRRPVRGGWLPERPLTAHGIPTPCLRERRARRA
jgi:hypothetical protein